MRIKCITNNLFLVLMVLSFVSCLNDDVYDPNSAQGTGNLVVPSDFDWATTYVATCGITSPVNTKISIYSNKTCKDDQLLAEVCLVKNETTEVTLDVPAACQALYVQYPAVNGTDLLEVTPQPGTRASSANITLPEDAIEVENDKNAYETNYYMPAKNTYGTILFEDLFPAKGDYDFNDYVAGYNVQVMNTQGSIPNNRDGIVVKLQIRAIGGTLPYLLGFELTPLQTKYVKDNFTITSGMNGISMELISTNDDDPAVFIVKGTSVLKDGAYYNTETLSVTPMPEITCSIIRDNKNDPQAAAQFSNLISSTNLNFFLQNSSTKEEIHLKGYGVTKYATNTNTTFCTADNFVWGMKIPALIPHAIEKTDITEAYPNFAGWVTSGGTQNTDWYNTYTESKVIHPGN